MADPLRDKRAIEELKYDYCSAVDATDVERIVDLFVADGRVAYRGGVAEPKTASGHEEISALYAQILDGSVSYMGHMVLNPRLAVDGDTATGEWFYVAVVVPSDGAGRWLHGEYEDGYERVDGEWRFASTTIEHRHSLPVDR
jgi:ketosteroid isomerase-like protein